MAAVVVVVVGVAVMGTAPLAVLFVMVAVAVLCTVQLAAILVGLLHLAD